MILRNPSLLAIVVAETVSGLGSRMTYLALPWFVLATTGSPSKMGWVLAAELVPMALLGIPSGIVVSRWGARTTMLASDLVRVPLMASIPLLHAAGALSFPLLLLLVAAFGCFWAPYSASQRVILPELLGDDERTLAQANSVVEGATRSSGLLGPPLAGLLIAWIGAANVLYLDAATFLVSFLLVAPLVPRREPPAETSDSGGVLAGIRFFVRDALMGRFVVVLIVFNALGQMLAGALPVLAFQRFHSSHVGGWLFGAFGVGGVLGTLVAFKLVAKVDPYKLALSAIWFTAPPVFVLALHAPLWTMLLALAVSAGSSPLVNAPMIAAMTKRTPPELFPKVMTAAITLTTLAGPVGLAMLGPMIENVGLSETFAFIAAGEIVATLLFTRALLGFMRNEAAAPVADAAAV